MKGGTMIQTWKPIVFMHLFILFSVCLWATTISDVILSQSPTGYWRFGETSGSTALDSSGNGYHGSYVGSYTLGTAGATFDSNTAFSLNGGGYMSVSVPIAPSFTIIAWAKSHSSTWNDYGWIASSREPNGFIMHPYPGSKSVSMYIIDYTSPSAYSVIGDAAPDNITQWHQYGISYDANTHKAYTILDGQIISVVDYNGARYNDTVNIWFGRDQYVSRYGSGSLDEAALFNRSLSASEISMQYQVAMNIPESQTCFLFLSGLGILFGIYRQKKQ